MRNDILQNYFSNETRVFLFTQKKRKGGVRGAAPAKSIKFSSNLQGISNCVFNHFPLIFIELSLVFIDYH